MLYRPKKIDYTTPASAQGGPGVQKQVGHYFGTPYLDMTAAQWAVVSAAIGLFLLPRTYLLLRDSVDVLLESTPAEVDLSRLRGALAEIPGVLDVHDLHVWSLTSGLHAMSAHIVRVEGTEPDDLLRRVREVVLSNFEIHHVTLQVESAGCEDAAHE